MTASVDDQQNSVVATARDRLRSTGYSSLDRIDCDFSDGILILSGPVGSYHHKQIAQTAVLEVEGVEQLVNQIEVRKPAR